MAAPTHAHATQNHSPRSVQDHRPAPVRTRARTRLGIPERESALRLGSYRELPVPDAMAIATVGGVALCDLAPACD